MWKPFAYVLSVSAAPLVHFYITNYLISKNFDVFQCYEYVVKGLLESSEDSRPESSNDGFSQACRDLLRRTNRCQFHQYFMSSFLYKSVTRSFPVDTVCGCNFWGELPPPYKMLVKMAIGFKRA